MDMPPKTQATKAKIDRLDYMKLKNFCAAKETISSKKAACGVLANHMSDKGLTSRICDELQLNTKNKNKTNPPQNKQKNLLKKWAKNLRIHFSKKKKIMQVACILLAWKCKSKP